MRIADLMGELDPDDEEQDDGSSTVPSWANAPPIRRVDHDPLDSYIELYMGDPWARFRERVAPGLLLLRVPQPVATEMKIPVVIPVEKRVVRRNEVESWVTLGRRDANDVVLAVPTVSGVHALLGLEDDRTGLVADAESTNGTFVEGERIEPNTVHRLTGGTAIGFGPDVSGHFHTTRSFYERYFDDEDGD